MGFEDLHVHRVMLEDTVRTEAFEAAIRQVVKPGMRVLDFGCGTGILSFFAARCGAEVVYAVDNSRFIRVAKEIAERNGFENIRFIHGDEKSLTLDEPVDLIVSETMGPFVLHNEWVLDSLFTVRDRFLAGGGIMIPTRVSMKLGFIVDRKLFARLSYFKKKPYGIDFSSVEEWPYFRTQVKVLLPDEVAPEVMDVRTMDFLECSEVPDEFNGVEVFANDTTIHGLCGWFEAHLTDSIRFGTGPFDEKTHWGQVLFPLTEPFHVRAGTELQAAVRPARGKDGKDTFWRWSIGDGNRKLEGDNFVHHGWVMRDLPEGSIV